MPTKIPWVKNPDGSQGITLNLKTGCLNHVDGKCKGGDFPCYAYRLANGRLHTRYVSNQLVANSASFEALTDPFHPRWWADRFLDAYKLSHRTRHGIFLDDMSDWMADYWPDEWTRAELDLMRARPLDRFYTLTKQAQNLPPWNPFPDNCWVGVTACNQKMADEAIPTLINIYAGKRYISIEPMLEPIDLTKIEFGRYLPENKPYYVNAFEDRYIFGDEGDIELRKIDWVIIGACTGTKPDMLKLIERYPALTLMKFGSKWSAQPPIERVEEIVKACDKAGIPVFLKDNLEPLLPVDLPFYKPAKVSTPTAIELVATVWKIRQELPQ